MKIIVGLGNPGTEYANTRHNVGFMMVDMLAQIAGVGWEDSKWKGVMAKTKDTILFKPTTYMNLSGDAVIPLLNFYKLDPKKDVIVLSDDLDMEFGKVRYRAKGSHGGQNGLRDIIAKLGTDEFARIKIGIGRNPQYEVVDWVLSKFTKSEQALLSEEIFPEVEKRLEEWLQNQ